MNERMKVDLIQHAINRIGVVMSDTCHLLETDEDIRDLYATVLGHAMCSVVLSLSEAEFPLFKKLPMTLRVYTVASHLTKALDSENIHAWRVPQTPQEVSDFMAALREIRRHFNFVVEVEGKA
jgi:hypothetical protein